MNISTISFKFTFGNSDQLVPYKLLFVEDRVDFEKEIQVKNKDK